jgi:hypothetical protein
VSDINATAAKLSAALDAMRSIHGDEWHNVAAPIKALIRRSMEATGTDNPIAVAIPAAKAMDRDGKSPLLLLAVAAEMAEEDAP